MNIQLQNVTYTYAGKYQRVTAVDGVSYTFHDGTLYTIMGASGSVDLPLPDWPTIQQNSPFSIDRSTLFSATTRSLTTA